MPTGKAGNDMNVKSDTAPALKPAMKLDMRGTTCPAPLLGANRLMETMKPGEVLLLLSDCPGTQDDLFAWSRHTDHHIVRTERLADGGHGYYIQRGHSRLPEANAVLDLRGTVCPGPIVEAKKLLNGMRSGETLKLVSNCPGVATDVADWVRVTGLKLLGTEEIGAGAYEFYIGKP
ncbi:Sulfur carrier protein TusA [Burkholderiales bacterium]|nr:Sulfur carrier protein TusA [Burkholderiales bacterium]